MKKIIKEWLFAFGVGSSSGGLVTFSGTTLFHRNHLDNKKNIEFIEKSTMVGVLTGGFICSTIINPIVSGSVLFIATFPQYWFAKRKLIKH